MSFTLPVRFHRLTDTALETELVDGVAVDHKGVPSSSKPNLSGEYDAFEQTAARSLMGIDGY